ncbi:MAG TPA: hypothetical protein VG897_15195 [Terriglobales bacterium]|nr:hypothetical protein [Terriglobales bacterium]
MSERTICEPEFLSERDEFLHPQVSAIRLAAPRRLATSGALVLSS